MKTYALTSAMALAITLASTLPASALSLHICADPTNPLLKVPDWMKPIWSLAIKKGWVNEETYKRLLSYCNVDTDKVNKVLGGDNTLSALGITNPDFKIPLFSVNIGAASGGIDWHKFITGSEVSRNAFKISNASIDLASSGKGVFLPFDLVKAQQLLNTAEFSFASNNQVNQNNNLATESVFKDSALVYSNISITPPNSTLEALEQSNNIAIANGTIAMSQTKHLQSLVSSQENINAAMLNQQNRELNKERKEKNYKPGERDWKIARDFKFWELD